MSESTVLSTPEQEAAKLVAAQQADIQVAVQNRVLDLPMWTPFSLLGLCGASKATKDEVFTVKVFKLAPGLDVTSEVEGFLEAYPKGAIYFKKITG